MVAAAQAVSEYRAGDRCHPRLQQTDPAPADRDRWPAMHLDLLVVAGTLVADDALDIDDMAAMNPDEPVVVEPRFDVPDGERAKQLVVAVEDVGVVRIGMDRDDVVAVHANAHYTYIFDGNDKLFCPLAIGDVESRLDDNRFVRVHRSHIVNIERVVGYKRSGDNEMVEMHGGPPVPVSRSRVGLLKSRVAAITGTVFGDGLRRRHHLAPQ